MADMILFLPLRPLFLNKRGESDKSCGWRESRRFKNALYNERLCNNLHFFS